MRHVVVVSAGGWPVADFWSPGKRYVAHRILPGNVIVYPAGMPHASGWSASKSTIADIAPELVQSVAGRDVAANRLEIHPAFTTQDDVVANLASMLGAEALADGPNGSLYGEGWGRRIERAKSLLANPKLPITEVALRLGFTDQSHFSTAFRRLTNTTPGRYREAVR